MFYDPRDDSLRFANGAVVPDDAAIWAELERRGLVREPTAAVPGRHARHLDIEAVRADLLATALATAQPAHRTAGTSSGDAMTSIDTTLLTWHAGHMPGTRYADIDRYRVVEVHAGRCYVIEQLGDDGLLAASFAETAATLTTALELVEQHRAGTLPAITYEEWAAGHLDRYTRERAALGDDATPADRHWYDRNIRYMQDTIRRHKELTAAGHLWCVTTGTGQHLVVLFGAVDHHRLHTCLRERRCGVCGQALQDRLVLMMRLSDLPLRCTSEPPLHPWCAAYSRTACPMLHGRMQHYRASPPAADDTTLPAPDTAARLGAAAEPWFSVWITDYALVTHHGTPAAAYRDDQVVRIRPVTNGPAGPPE